LRIFSRVSLDTSLQLFSALDTVDIEHLATSEIFLRDDIFTPFDFLTIKFYHIKI
jgi:hypothetical protein